MLSILLRGFVVVASLVVALAALSPLTASAQSQAVKNRVVFQVSDGDPQKWSLVLNNAHNVQAELGSSDVEVEIVAYGPGIGMLKGDSPVATRIADALKSGVSVVACRNTMKGMKLVDSDMLPEIGYVPAGVVELMKKQQQGWSYIRP